MATIKVFRCLNPNCITGGKWHNFASETPKCPKCEIEAKDPKFGHLIKRLTSVHFDPPSRVPGIGENHRACDTDKHIAAAVSALGEPDPFHGGTGDPDAVTCLACRATKEWEAAWKALHEDELGHGHLAGAMARLQQFTTNS